MGPGIDGQSDPVVRQLVKLPVINRVKAVKDLMLGELGAIRAQVQVIRNVAQALLANGTPLLEALVNLVEAVRDTRLAVERSSDAVLDTLRQARQDALRQAQELHHAVRKTEEGTRQQELLLLEALTAGREQAQREVEALRGVLQASRYEVRVQLQALHDGLQAGRDEARVQLQALHDGLQAGRDEARVQLQALHDGLQAGRDEARVQLQALHDGLQAGRDEARVQLQALHDGLQAGRDEARVQLQALHDGLQAGRDEARVQLQALHDGLQAGRDEARVQLQALHDGRARVLKGGNPEEPEVGLMAHLYTSLPSQIAVDIGANVGDVSHRLLGAGYEVFAFEPHGEVFRQLNDRFSSHTAFHGFPLAVGPVDETRPLHLAADQSGCNRYRDSTLYSSLLHHAMPEDLVFTSTVSVTVRSLASLHASGHLPADVGLVKIDTEGFDLEVIRGMGPHRYPVVVAEYWDEAMPFGASGAMNRLDALVREMTRRDYRWYIVFYRVWGTEGTSFYCNHDRSVTKAWGNVYFFREHSVFADALKWCAAVLPVTYVDG